jgi:hypothetical protein
MEKPLNSLPPGHFGEHPIEFFEEDTGRLWLQGNGRTAMIEQNNRYTEIIKDGTIWHGGPKTTAADGNLTAVRHGAYSMKQRKILSDEIAQLTISEAPWVLDFDWPTIQAYAMSMSTLKLLHEAAMNIALAVDGENNVVKVPAYIWSEISKATTNVLRAADNLGLSPSGRAKIMKDAGIAQHFNSERLASLVTRGKELRESQAALR